MADNERREMSPAQYAARVYAVVLNYVRHYDNWQNGTGKPTTDYHRKCGGRDMGHLRQTIENIDVLGADPRVGQLRALLQRLIDDWKRAETLDETVLDQVAQLLHSFGFDMPERRTP